MTNYNQYHIISPRHPRGEFFDGQKTKAEMPQHHIHSVKALLTLHKQVIILITRNVLFYVSGARKWLNFINQVEYQVVVK